MQIGSYSNPYEDEENYEKKGNNCGYDKVK